MGAYNIHVKVSDGRGALREGGQKVMGPRRRTWRCKDEADEGLL